MNSSLIVGRKSAHLDRKIIDGTLTLFHLDPLVPSLQGDDPGAEQSNLFFLFLQLNPLFLDPFVGDSLSSNEMC